MRSDEGRVIMLDFDMFDRCLKALQGIDIVFNGTIDEVIKSELMLKHMGCEVCINNGRAVIKKCA